MIKNVRKLDRFYRKVIREERIPYEKAFLIYDGLYREAAALGVLEKRDIMEGLEVDLRVARALNTVRE